MIHPFAGVVDTNDALEQDAQPSRRTALGSMVFATAGALGLTRELLSQPATDALNEEGIRPPQVATTLAIGEEGGTKTGSKAATTHPFGEEAGRVTSFAMPGLEDGGRRPPTRALNEQGGTVTTQALGEEGGKPDPQPTTLALGEEGGKPQVTTKAIGEEGAKPQPKPVTEAVNEQGGKNPPRITTFAVGEEGGKQPPVQATTLAVGEEGGQRPPIKISTKRLGEEGGNPPVATTEALGEEAASTRALGEEGGKPLTRARNEEGRPVPVGVRVLVQPMSQKLTDKQMQQQWATLANEDLAVALQGCAVLYSSADILSFLKENLKLSETRIDSNKVDALVAQLDSDDFQERENAEKALAALGDAALSALVKAAETSKSGEVRIRTTRLIDKSPKLRQLKHGLQILVALRTPEAKKLLSDIAESKQNPLLTEEAGKALAKWK